MPSVRIVDTRNLSAAELEATRRLLDAAFAGDFSDEDWDHARGGWHALIEDSSSVLGHASVVPRRLIVAGAALHTGYVEAVAVRPDLQRRGLGTALMSAITDLVRERFELGALSTGEWSFYARLGWERWRGPTFIRLADGTLRRSPGEDDAVMVLRTGRSQELDLSAAIACDERSGDSW
jgi:aminoglycoside 2'-N-acetyltransferase I